MSDHAFFVLPVNGSRIVRFDSPQRPGFEYPGHVSTPLNKMNSSNYPIFPASISGHESQSALAFIYTQFFYCSLSFCSTHHQRHFRPG